MSFSFSASPVLLALCLLVAAGFSYLAYRRTVPPVSTAKRILLGGLRFVALALILFLLFEPIARQFSRTERPPVLAVLVDDSESLRVTTASGDSAASSAEARVQTALEQLRDSGLEGEQRLFRFSQTLDPAESQDSLRFDGSRTDIAAALVALRDQLQDANLQGVALVSDGQYNTGRNPLYVAERYTVPIHTIAVGDTTRQRDVQVRRITTNDIAYVNTELPVQVGLRAEDYGGSSVRVRLLQDGEELAAETVTLPSGTAEVPVDLAFTPEATGLQRLTVRVSRLDGEATYRNNSQSFSVQVLENKRRVLLLGAAPSPNFAAVRRLLSADPNTETTALVPQRSGDFYQGALPDDLSTFDVFVLAGFPGPSVPDEVVRRVADAAETGERPVLFLLDRQTDLQALDAAFEDVLPVALDRVRPGFVEASFELTEQARSHPVFSIEDAPEDLWDQLPPLQYNESRWQPSPDARVLATASVRGVSLDDPLLVLRRRAGQRTAALLATGTWRWANLPSDLAAAEELWPGLLNNLVQWVAAREDDRLVRVQPVEQTFGGGAPIQFTGQVYNESLTPLPDATVSVTITDSSGAQFPYTMEPVGNGRYVLDVGSLPEGSYRYTAEASQDDASVGSDQGQFSVGSLTLEYRETRANTALMQQIAQRSGGTFFTPESASELPRILEASSSFSSLVVEEERDTELAHLYGFLIVIVTLLATEWAIRKRSGMV